MNAKIKKVYNKKCKNIGFILHQIDYIEQEYIFHSSNYTTKELKALEEQLNYLKALEKSYSLYLEQL